MKRITVAGFFLILMTTIANAKSFVISDIHLVGLQRVPEERVMGILPLSAGDTLNKRGLSEAAHTLFATGLFEDIKVGYTEENVLIIGFTERPYISKVSIKGNRSIPTAGLLDYLKEQGLSEDNIFQNLKLESVRNELQALYTQEGRYSALISTKILEEPENTVSLEINIDEGQISGIREISLIGNSVFSDEELMSVFQLNDTQDYFFSGSKNKYSRIKLLGDIERLSSYYLDRGYINMQVTSTQVSISPDKKNVYVTISINEGSQYSIKDIKLAGDLKGLEKNIYPLILLKRGDIFSKKSLNEISRKINTYFANKGYMFVKTEFFTELGDRSKTASITFSIDPGKKAYVDQINFHGNTLTKDEVLRRELVQMEASVSSDYLINESKHKLERLGLFNKVEVETSKLAGKDNVIDIIYHVEEKPSTQLVSMNLGYGSNSGLVLDTSYTNSNILGSGNKMHIDLSHTLTNNSYNLTYFNPQWISERIGLGYNFSYVKRNDNLNVGVTNYAMNTLQMGLDTAYPLSNLSQIKYRIDIEKKEIATGVYTANEIFDFLKNEKKSTFLNLKLSSNWSNSTVYNRDSIKADGRSHNVGIEFTVPGSAIKFYKVHYIGEMFRSLNDFLTMHLRTNLAYGDGYGISKELPFYENYSVSGLESIPGFAIGSLGPRSTPSLGYEKTGYEGTLEDPNQDPLAFGGNLLIKGAFEILFPTPFFQNNPAFSTRAFFSIGNVFNTKNDKREKVILSNLASSIGLSLTWKSPIAPLTFTLSKPLNNPKHVPTQTFQFTIGQVF